MAAIVLVAATAATPAPTANAAPTPAPAEFYGTNIQALVRVGFARSGDWSRYLTQGVSGGLGITRYDAQWNLVEPNAPVNGIHSYSWTALDGIAAAIAGSGGRWFPVLTLPPAWARGPATSLSPTRFGDYAAFAAAFVGRYGPGGAFWSAHPDLPQLPIQQLEVWTEANSAHFWTANPNAADYLDVFKQVRAAVRSVNPAIGVLVSLGWQDFANYTRALYAAGLRGSSEGIAFHPYAPTAAGVVRLTRTLREVTAAAGEPDLPIYMTEIGWPRAQTPPGPTTVYNGPVSDAARAATASLAGDALAVSDCNVRNYIYYSLVEEARDPNNNEDWLGLLNANGTPTQTMTALAGSARRWKAQSAIRSGRKPMLKLCSGTRGEKLRFSNTLPPADGQLPVELKLPVPLRSKSCFVAQTSYYGDPLEDVTVFVRDYRGKRTGVTTNAYGQGRLCLNAAARKRPVLAWGRVDGMASSRLLHCGARCAPVSCRAPSLSVKPLSGSVRVKVRCGRISLWHQRITVLGGRSGKRVLARARTTRAGVKVKVPASGAIRVRYEGDAEFKFKARTKRVRS